MSARPEPAIYMRKAVRALSSAQSLLRDGDVEGSCNRAYYAMFNAAYAALLAAGVDTPSDGYKTHNGLIAAFGKYLVSGGFVDPELGRAINKVQRLRQIADYVGDPPSADDALWAVHQAVTFAAALNARFALNA